MQKLYYTISEVSKEIGEEAHILRYWEKEFDQLKPKKNRAGKRNYTKDDIEKIRIIKKLIRDEKLSIEGAREKFSIILVNPQKEATLFDFTKDNNNNDELIEIRDELNSLISELKREK